MTSSMPLLGVKAYVDVRSKHANHSSAVADELMKLGAVVYDKLLPTVTHIIFKDGSKVTETKASKFGAHIVSVNWVDSCKTSNERVSEHLYSMGNSTGKKKQKSMQPKDFQQELQHVSDRLVAKVKKRRSGIQIPSPLSIVADRININDYLQAPRTPPAMQKRIDQLRERQASSNKISASTTPARVFQHIDSSTLGTSPDLPPSQTDPRIRVIVPMSISKSASRPGADHVVPETPFHWNVKMPQPVFTPPADRTNLRLRTRPSPSVDVSEEPAAVEALDLSSDSLSPTLDWDRTIDSFLQDKMNNSQLLSPEAFMKEIPEEFAAKPATPHPRGDDSDTDDELPSLDELSKKSKPSSTTNNNNMGSEGDLPLLNDLCTKPKFVPPYKTLASMQVSVETDATLPLLDDLSLASPVVHRPVRKSLGVNSKKTVFVPPVLKTINSPNKQTKNPKSRTSVSDILTLHSQVVASGQAQKSSINLSSAFAKLKTPRRSSIIPSRSGHIANNQKQILSGEHSDIDKSKVSAKSSCLRKSFSATMQFTAGDKQSTSQEENSARSQPTQGTGQEQQSTDKSKKAPSKESQPIQQGVSVDNFILEPPKRCGTNSRKSMVKKVDSYSDVSTAIDESVSVEEETKKPVDGGGESSVQARTLKISRRLSKRGADNAATNSTELTVQVQGDVNKPKSARPGKRRRTGRMSTSNSLLSASESNSDMASNKHSFTSTGTTASESTVKTQRRIGQRKSCVVDRNSADSGVDSTLIDLNENSFSGKRKENHVHQERTEVEDDDIWTFESRSVATTSAGSEAVRPEATQSSSGCSKLDEKQTVTPRRAMHLMTPISNLTHLNNGRPIIASRKLHNVVLTSLHSGNGAKSRDRSMVRSIVKKLGGYHINVNVDSNTTHVVCGDNRRTLNVLKGISRGCWIVSVEWVLASLDADDWLRNEETFLMTESFRGATPQRRQQIQKNKNKLLATIGSIYVCSGTIPPQQELMALIQLNGGKVVKTRRACQLIIGRASDVRIGRAVIKEGWILDCVTAQKLLDCKPYKWDASCSSSDNDENSMSNIFDS